MSRLSKEILTHKTNERAPLPSRITVRESWEDIRSMPSVGTLYAVSAEVGVRVVVSDTRGPSLVEATAAAKRRIVEEVFGEFRPLIRNIEECLYQCDFAKARDALHILEKEMFE